MVCCTEVSAAWVAPAQLARPERGRRAAATVTFEQQVDQVAAQVQALDPATAAEEPGSIRQLGPELHRRVGRADRRRAAARRSAARPVTAAAAAGRLLGHQWGVDEPVLVACRVGTEAVSKDLGLPSDAAADLAGTASVGHQPFPAGAVGPGRSSAGVAASSYRSRPIAAEPIAAEVGTARAGHRRTAGLRDILEEASRTGAAAHGPRHEQRHIPGEWVPGHTAAPRLCSAGARHYPSWLGAGDSAPSPVALGEGPSPGR